MIKGCLEKICRPIEKYLSVSQSTKDKILELSQKANAFVKKNKATVFFAATSLFVLMATASPLAETAVVCLVAAGVLTASVVQAYAFLNGSKGFADKQTDEKLSVLLGVINLSAWIINPQFGVATTFVNIGVKSCAYPFRNIFHIKQKDI